MVDMRKRFRGNQPIAVSKELEGEKPPQLYAGGGMGTGVKATSGDEDQKVETVVGLDGERRVVR